MPDINWDGDAASAPFRSRYDEASGNLILAETDTGTGLFEWDGSAWQFRGPVEMNGEDVSGIGTLTATSGNFDSVDTEQGDISGDFVVGDVDTSREEYQQFDGPTLVQGDNTATTILSTGINNGDLFGLIIVMGDQQGSGVSFSDLVVVVRSSNISAEISLTNVGSSGPRSYSLDGNDVQVAIDDSGNEYQVTAKLVGGDA